MKKIFFISILCLLIIFIGMSMISLDPEKDSSQLTILIAQEPSTLNPNHSPAYNVSQISFYNLYEPLIKASFDGKIEPYLLESYERLDHGLSYIFTLKKNLVFHNGQPLDSKQLHTCLLDLKSNTKHPHPEHYQAISEIEILTPLSLKITLKNQDPYFLYNLSRPTSAMTYPGNEFIGTGPYIFQNWQKNNALIFKKNPSYREDIHDAFQTVSYQFVPDPYAQYHLMQMNHADILLNFRQFAASKILKKHPNIAYHQAKTHGKIIIAMNHDHPLLSQKRARETLASLIDSSDFIKANFFENSRPLGSHFSPFHQAAIPPQEKTPGDLTLFQNIKPLKILIPPFEYAETSAELLTALFKKNNIPFTMISVEWGEWLQSVYFDKNYDLTLISHIEPLDIGIYGNENYYFNYKNQTFKEALETHEPLATLQKILQEDHANLFIMSMPTLILYQKHLSNLATENSNFIFPIAQIKSHETQ